MSLEARITTIEVDNSGFTNFTFEIYDPADPGTVLATNTQGIAPIIETVPTPAKRLVPERKDDGSGDVIFAPNEYDVMEPVMYEEDYEEMVATGNFIAPSSEMLEESIRNYVRDVYALRMIQPSVEAGATFDVSG